MNNCAFTIVAKNYIGLAKVLKKSIVKVTNNIDFYIIVADEDLKEEYREPGILVAKEILDISRKNWIDMSFKYNLTEFCTAIKPFCFLYFLSQYERVLYFDPDCYIFRDIDTIYDRLSKHSIILTPHIIYPDLANDCDRVFLQAGIYNLGFIGFSNSVDSLKLINWWGNKLIDNCFDDVLDYTFTDQKWMNYATAFLPEGEVVVMRDMGMDFAPWNFYERRVVKEGDEFMITKRGFEEVATPLVFAHFSGYDYKNFINGNGERARRQVYPTDFDDIAVLLNFYRQKLSEDVDMMKRYLSFPYSYSCFSNGVAIEKFHRRLYRSLSKSQNIENPFNQESSFYHNISSIKAFSKEKEAGETGLKNDYSGLLCKFNKLMKIAYRILGYKRYVALLRLLKHFSRFESQIFLVDKRYYGNSIDIMNNK